MSKDAVQPLCRGSPSGCFYGSINGKIWKLAWYVKWKKQIQSLNIQTEAVLQRCSYKKMFWNTQQIYWRTPMPKCDFQVDTKQLYWDHWDLVNLLHIFRTVSHKNVLSGLPLNLVMNKRQKGDIKIPCNRNYVYCS